jgi:hypothetical protein
VKKSIELSIFRSLIGNSKKNEKEMKRMREELREALQKEKEL